MSGRSKREAGEERTYREHRRTRATHDRRCSSSVARACVSHLESQQVQWVLSSSKREGIEAKGAVVGDDVVGRSCSKRIACRLQRRDARSKKRRKKIAEGPPRTGQMSGGLNKFSRRVRTENRLGPSTSLLLPGGSRAKVLEHAGREEVEALFEEPGC